MELDILLTGNSNAVSLQSRTNTKISGIRF